VDIAAFGASHPLPLVPAKVSCLNRQRSLGPRRRNASSCPIADAPLATSECLLVGVKPSDQAGAPFSDADPQGTLGGHRDPMQAMSRTADVLVWASASNFVHRSD